MRLRIGEKAKDFQIKDVTGKDIFLSNFSNRKILLSFFRYASCPLCNLRINQLIQHFDEFKSKDLVILAFFESPPESIAQHVGKQQAPFSIIPDPQRIVYKLYGVESSLIGYLRGGVSRTMIKAHKAGFRIASKDGDRYLLPADFLIENMEIKEAFYGKTISEHIPIENIYNFINS
ncbi:unnamed protein product [marine sediment metagenome]|uniref:Thioredoxin domain-containing protein n=1 Tax=marine sediment metagenome TaxID=412755 RepID=X1GKH9_9ZZZZ